MSHEDVISDITERPDSEESQETDEEFQPPIERKSSEVTLTLPRKDLMRGSAELATRCRVSNRVATAMTAKFVKLGGGELKEFSLSKTTSHRHRNAEIIKSEETIKQNFKTHMPQFLIIHWDGKVIKYEHRRESDERLAIVASIPLPDTPTQFLAAPHIPDGTGQSMTNALLEALHVWSIPLDNIIGMSWDTTASNTGHVQGSATLFEQHLGRGILWLACRHHVGELHIRHADKEARGAWNGWFCLCLIQYNCA